jgi:excisionase family DNA binding protein
MLQYYTLEEAANLLGMHPDGAKKLLDDRKVRQYRDGRGKVRYVASAVDELVRTLGGGSDPELPLGEAARAKKAGNTPRPTKAQGDEGSTSNFDLGPGDSADVPIGHEPLDASGSASKRSGRSPRPAGSKSPAPRSPAPKSGSDSDVRLVADASDLEFQIAADSDVKMVDEGSSPSRSGVSGPKSGIGSKSGVRKGPGDSHDSEVRIVPMMDVPSDSDVRIADAEGSVELGHPPAKKHSDSDIRLEEASAHPPRADEGSDDAHVTEEIDLDAEARKHAEAQKAKGKSKMKRADSKQPAASPFELSDDQPPQLPKGGKKKPDSSSDFELTPAAESDAVELSSGEMAAMAAADADSSEEEVDLGEVSGGAGTSGINLDAPADSGISLEGTGESHDEMEFELSLDSGSTPKPGPKSGKQKKAKAPAQEDSSSEFELTLDSDSSDEQPRLQKAAKGPAEEDSDSEFELTLDDSGGLVPLEGEKAAESSQGEGDIFETDFEVPALDEESGSEAVALDESDTDLESSDFDLALEEGDAAGGEESGSQVVALEDEEEVDAAAETVQRPKKKAARQQAAAAASAEGEALEELADVDDEAAVSEESVEEAPARGRAAPVVAAAPAEWGAMPGVVMMFCVVFMILAGLMGFELVNNMVGYQQPGKVSGFLTESLAKTFDMDLPKD